MVNALEPAACHRPIHNIVMDIGRCHIIYILRVVTASDGFSHTDKLALLSDNVAYVAALTDPGKLTVINGGSIHDNRSNCSHSIVPLLHPPRIG